jgi:hypothetical protein
MRSLKTKRVAKPMVEVMFLMLFGLAVALMSVVCAEALS